MDIWNLGRPLDACLVFLDDYTSEQNSLEERKESVFKAFAQLYKSGMISERSFSSIYFHLYQFIDDSIFNAYIKERDNIRNSFYETNQGRELKKRINSLLI